ncbi:MAG: hypothetical protein PUF12_08845 [Thermoflexaceae bacterium]|nr:hypothetical protein [Thermoflexaceae bacterium]
MKKFLTGLRYGNWLTKLYVLAIPICILVGVGLVISSFFVNSMLLFLVGVAVGIAAIALWINFTIEETEIEQASPSKKPRQKEKNTQTIEPPAASQDKILKSDRIQEAEKSLEPDKAPESDKAPEPDKRIEKEETEQLLAEYDAKAMKQVFYKYKVRKDHRTIIIDEWKEKGVYQSPVYIWLHRSQVHFLVIGKDIQEITVPAGKLSPLQYRRGVICQAKDEYLQFRKESLLSTVFSPFLPVYHEGDKDGRPVVYKNLFEMGNGIRITNPSARIVMDMLQLEFQVDDIVTRDLRYNAFFKEIYTRSILFREQVITAKEYQENVNDILHNLASSDVAEQEYEETLQALFQNKLITQEYIEYYKQYRERIQAEQTTDIKAGKRTGKKSLRKSNKEKRK